MNPDRDARPRKFRRLAATVVVGLVLAGLIVGWIQCPTFRDDSTFIQHQAADAAIKALRSRDLDGVEDRLAANRGKSDFAYFFASQASPRALGDALGSVAGEKEGELKNGVDAHQYDVTLTDLAGALALATYGTGDRALPASWADKFATATTTPGASKNSDAERAAQDQADKQNLLLLLARGYWSTDFLQTMTQAYWTFDHHEGSDAWPDTKSDGAKYAPAPNGTYLTDGIVALTAALTANPAASAWAFTDFQPGTQTVDDSDDLKVGKFTHFLFVDHQFPAPPNQDGDDASLGMTAAVTALGSAVDATGGILQVASPTPGDANASGTPTSDLSVLQEIARAGKDDNGSFFGHAWDVAKHVVKVAKDAVLAAAHFIVKWGHPVLDALTLLTVAPDPRVKAVGVVAGLVNAGWYGIDGDWADAGLALLTVAGGLGLGSLAVKAIAAGRDAGGAAVIAQRVAEATKLTKIAEAWQWIARVAKRPYVDIAGSRVYLRQSVVNTIDEGAERDRLGRLIDPNTKLPIKGTPDIGHKPGFEWRCFQALARAKRFTRQMLIELANDASHYQLEDRNSNRSRVNEATTCAI